MPVNLHYNVITPLLLSVLKACMSEKLFDPIYFYGKHWELIKPDIICFAGV